MVNGYYYRYTHFVNDIVFALYCGNSHLWTNFLSSFFWSIPASLTIIPPIDTINSVIFSIMPIIVIIILSSFNFTRSPTLFPGNVICVTSYMYPSPWHQWLCQFDVFKGDIWVYLQIVFCFVALWHWTCVTCIYCNKLHIEVR